MWLEIAGPLRATRVPKISNRVFAKTILGKMKKLSLETDLLQTDVPLAATRLIAHFFATLYGPNPDPAGHLACYSSDALILVGSRVFKKHQLPVALYLETMTETRDILTIFGPRCDGLRMPTFELLRAEHACADQDVAAVRVRVREMATDQEFAAVFVLDDEGLLGGAVLETEKTVDTATAQALVAAEYAQLPPLSGPDDLFLNGFELSFSRVFISDTSALNFLPEARFSCQQCGESCRVGSQFEVRITDASKSALAAFPWDKLRPGRFEGVEMFQTFDTPDPAGFGQQQGLAARNNEYCVFYDEDGSCAVHQITGRAVVPTCHKYPFMFTRTPEGVDVWTSFHCHSALYGLGEPLGDRARDIRSRLWANRYFVWRTKEEVFLRSPAQPLSWEAYRAVENALLAFLDPDDTGALNPRLQAAEDFVNALERGFLATGFDGQRVCQILAESQSRPVLSRESKGIEDDLAVELLCLLVSWNLSPDERAAYLAGSFAAEYTAIVNQPLTWDPPTSLICKYLRHCVFHKIFLQTAGISFSWRYVLLSWAALRLYVRYLVYLESKNDLGARDPSGAAPRARRGSAGTTLPFELPMVPDRDNSAQTNHPLLPHLQKAIMDLDMFVVHLTTLFEGAFLKRDLQRERLIAPATGSALIWG